MEKATKVYNVDDNKVEKLKFLRMGFIDQYNNTMGDVDLADQLRGSYRFDMWVRNRKWWWGFGVLVTNAYICYCKVYDEQNIPKKHRRSHLEFRKDLMMAWIDEDYFWRYLETNKPLQKGKAAETVCSPITLDTDIQSVGISTSSRTRNKDYSSAVSKRIRCTAIIDTSLDPQNGSLKCRLRRFGFDHMQDKPTNRKDKTRCQLHRWLGYEYCKQLSYYEERIPTL